MLPGALATQRQYGIPASVTIAQAIDESGWGQSSLARLDHNLFGIKGTGPAGSTSLPTVEYQNGQPVSTVAGFRTYDTAAQSVEDHGRLLATSGYYGQAMAARHDPNGFANALTGVYATDPQYGAKLITLMRHYNLYRFDQPGPAASAAHRTGQGIGAAGSHRSPGSGAGRAAAPRSPAPGGGAAIPGLPGPAAPGGGSPAPAPSRRTSPGGPVPTTTPEAPAVPARSSPSQSPGTPAQSPVPLATPTTSAPAPAATSATPAVTPTMSAPASTGAAAASTGPAAGSGGTPGAAHPPGPARGAASSQASVPGGPARTGAGPGPGGPLPTPSPSPAAAPTAPAPASPAPGGAASAGSATAGPASAGSAQAAGAKRLQIPASWQARRSAPRGARTARYQARMPQSVRTAFLTAARAPLVRAEPLYRDVAGHSGLPWELLAACDWMQCEAQARYSAVHGERLGSINPDGSCYRTRSAALEQCADDLIKLAWEIYRIDPTAAGPMSVRELASVFAAFRWGGLLRAHRTSAMEFPYSVAGLTIAHMAMRWPGIADSHAPDKPGTRFRRPFGAVPVVLGLGYPAVV